MLLLLLLLFIPLSTPLVVIFNDTYSVYTGNEYVEFVNYDFTVRNNRSNIFMISDLSGKLTRYCVDECSGIYPIKSILHHVSIVSSGPTRLEYFFDVSSGDFPSSSSDYRDEVVYSVVGIIGGLIIVGIVATFLWYGMKDRRFRLNCFRRR